MTTKCTSLTAKNLRVLGEGCFLAAMGQFVGKNQNSIVLFVQAHRPLLLYCLLYSLIGEFL